jgi:phenylalanyl-tRNA synthetase beta chain
MRVSLEWLNEYVDIAGLAPETIAASLTNAGLEVEHIEHIGPQFSGVVVAKVQTVEPHPNADRLRLVTVSLGPFQSPVQGETDPQEADQTQEQTPVQPRQAKVVCGAPNVREGMLIAFAQEGATVLSRKDNTRFTLEKTKIRGVESAGMICSIDELGLEGQFEKAEDGIWPIGGLVQEAQLGQDLKQALNLQGDVILEVAPTANRGDLMSMMGVAREVAALFDRPLHHPDYPHFPDITERAELQILLKDPTLCRYYGGVIMRNLRIGSSPDWMGCRLQAAGVRSINNVVDITNYVMLEMGQPLHAFDQNKLGVIGQLDVRRAREGEKLTTLDGVERALTPESVVIAMNDRPVAMAGLMGGASTEIDEQSRHLFLESAYFLPPAIRKSAKSVGLRSEASARFERGVDLENCRNALLRAAQLLRQHAGAEFVRLLDSPALFTEAPKITLHVDRIEKILGLSIDPDTVARILKKLGFRLQPASKENRSVVVAVPSFRQEDVKREIDLIEEVVRIYGYDKVPYTLPLKTGVSAITPRARLVRGIGEAMRSQGLQEVVTTSLIGPHLLEKTGFTVNDDQLVSVLNSHSSEHTQMRQSLLPNLIEVAKFNQAQGAEDVWIYELGRTYFRLGKPNHKNSGVSERLHLAGLVTGSTLAGGWQRKEPADFYLLKGILESLLSDLRVNDALRFAPTSDVACLHPGKAASILLGGSNKSLGFLGELHPDLQKTLKFRLPVYVYELNVELLFKALKQSGPSTQVARIAPYPSVERDMALLAPNSLHHQDVINVLTSAKEPLLRHIALFDEYRSEQLGADRRSLAYRLTFRCDEATMTDVDVDQRMGRLKESLSKALPIQFR